MWRRGLIAVFLLAICGLGAQPADLPGASPRALAFSRRAAGAAQIVDLPATYRCPGCSVVLISIDTLRADHLGTYGYSAPTSPGIDRFALDSAVFRDAIAVAPSTLRSHASIFASVFPHQHGARRHPPAAVPEEALTIAELPTTISVDRIDELSREAQPRGTFDPADVSQVVRAYDGGIRSVDEAFGELVGQLRRRRVYDDALIVFVSDHGEELGEHGTVGHHSHTLHDEVLKVPLIVKYPRAAFAGARIGSQVRGIDIAPTIADVLDIEIPPSFEGATLTAAITGADRGVRWALSETGQETPSLAVRTDRWKLYDGRLFDLLADPGETEDVSDRYPTVRLAMETALARLLTMPSVGEATTVQPGEDVLRQLRALGYIR